MYFPYLRGRQFELIALRELVELDLLGKHVIPIVEPIKATSTLRLTLEKFVELEREFVFILNPQVGYFASEYKELDVNHDLVQVINNEHIIKSHIMNKDSEIEIAEFLNNGGNSNDLIVVSTNRDCLSTYHKLFSQNAPRFVLIPDNTTFRRGVSLNRVLFVDHFPKEARNADYKDKDEFFSEDHLFFKDENYLGFSDYSIVGSDFNEGGFAPYAVAIHITYFGEDDELRVISFVSDSNDDISDPANKYYEALTHLVNWLDSIEMETYALEQFKKHHADGTYPGLGTVKKLAIMHHLELMSNYLDGKNRL